MRYIVPLLILVIGLYFLFTSLSPGCEPRPAECRVYEDTHTCISRLDERRREIGEAVARALDNLE